MDRRWSRMFDRVVVIRNTEYSRARGGALDAELRRVGLGDVAVRWTFPSPFLQPFARCVRFRSGGIGNFDETMFGMYAELKTSLATGVDRLLVLEDDVRFLSDLDMLDSMLASVPPDFVNFKLTWIRRGGLSVDDIRDVPAAGGHWIPTTGIHTRDTGAIAFSREGMQWMVECYESSLWPGNPGMQSCDLYDRPPWHLYEGSRTYLAVPLAARQAVDVGSRMSSSNLDRLYAPFEAPCGYGGAT